MSWKTIVIKDGNKVNLFLNNLVINLGDKNYKIPISDLYSIIFENYKTVITTRILTKLSEYKVLVLFCDSNLMPVSILQPFKGNFEQLERIRKQLSWAKENKLEVWAEVVKRKIEQQIEVLKLNDKSMHSIELLYKYIDEIKLGDISNREAHAAKVYFNSLFGNSFKRDEENHINASLNFGYTILRSAFSRSIVSKGYIPTISIFHSNKYNAFALSDDLMEPFRPIIDNFVYKSVLKDDYFSRKNKLEIINLLNCKINYEGKKMFLTKAIDEYIDYVVNQMNIKIINEIKIPYISTIEYYDL